MSADPPYELIDPIARAVSDLAREISAVGPLALYIAHTNQVVPLGLWLPERKAHECTPAEAYPEIATNLAALATRVGE